MSRALGRGAHPPTPRVPLAPSPDRPGVPDWWHAAGVPAARDHRRKARSWWPGARLRVSWKRDPIQLGPPGWLPIPVAGRAALTRARFAQVSSVLAGAVALGLALYAWQRTARASRHLAAVADELRAVRDRRAASQRELEVARTALAAVVEQAPVGIVQLDPGAPPAANAEALRLLGSQEELRARLAALSPWATSLRCRSSSTRWRATASIASAGTEVRTTG